MCSRSRCRTTRQKGHIRLDPIGPNLTCCTSTADIAPEIYELINQHNEDSMRAASEYLTDHPDSRADLIDA